MASSVKDPSKTVTEEEPETQTTTVTADLHEKNVRVILFLIYKM